MLSLTRIFLYNWHRFKYHLIDVQDSLYFTGSNAAGKSTILDAMQVVLLADLNLIDFNSSVQEQSKRTLDGFVRCKLSETRLLRPGSTIAYIALEFSDEKTEQRITIGCCIEASETLGSNGARGYFILREPLDTSLFIPQGSALNRQELKRKLLHRSKARYYELIGEYQDDMLDVLGGLNRRFLDLFRRALSFKPITKIDDFVQQWLLSPRPLDLQNLQQVMVRLGDLEQSAKIVNNKLALLEKISEAQKNCLRFKELQAQYEVLYALLNEESAQRATQDVEQQLNAMKEQIQKDNGQVEQLEAVIEGAKKAKETTERQLYSLDVVRQRKDLQKEIDAKKQDVKALLAQKQTVIQQLQRVASALRQVAYASFLEADEQQVLQAFVHNVASLMPDEPLYIETATITRQTMTALEQALERVRERIYSSKNQLTLQRDRLSELSSKIEALKRGASISYPPSVIALRDTLEPLIGTRPIVLCELVEVPDERWQRAVEAMLGNRRFNLIVPPETYETVLDYIEQIKANSRFHDARVLDLERASREARSALPRSLALQVQTDNPALRAYLDSVLGAIITCMSAREVRQYHRAITPDLIYYSEWAIQVLPHQQYERWFVGKRAHRSHIETYEQERRQLQAEYLPVSTQHEQAINEKGQIDHKDALSFLLPTLNKPPDERPLRAKIARLQEELDGLDLSEADKLEAQVNRLARSIADDERVWQGMVGERANHISAKDSLEGKVRDAAITVSERMQAVKECINNNPIVEGAARTLFEAQSKEVDLTQVSSNAQRSAKNFTTQANVAQKTLSDLRLEYNITYHFVGLIDVIDEPRYTQEQERLAATQLPLYTTQIEQAKLEAGQELREHVLHKLRENIQQAKEELRRMNDALRPLTFHGDRYQFHWEVASHVREYYRLIEESQFIGHNALFESSFYEQNKDAFEQFYHELIQPAPTDTEKKMKEALTDYRTYLKYDIEVKGSNGTTSLLSNIVGETSGGETQTPFYLAIAASFVQLYRMMEQKSTRHSRPTIGLVVFDEAFNKMDQEHISVTLDMFHQFKLQIVTATPLERCEYIVPKMCTNLVVTRVREDIHTEDYRNYAARLKEKYAELK